MNDPLSTISGCFISSVASYGPLFAVFGCHLSAVAGDSPLFAVSDSGSLSSMSPTSSWESFLLCILSHTRCFSLLSLLFIHSFLPFSPPLLARNLTPHTRKRLFNQAFITQKPITSTKQ